MRRELRNLSLAAWLLGACAACVGSDETRDLADALDEALDPTPEYVDEPARRAALIQCVESDNHCASRSRPKTQ